jgi:hypothetical protein
MIRESRDKWLRPVFAGLMVAGITTAHVHVVQQGPDYTGLLLILDHLFDLIAVLGLVAICAGLGSFAFHLLNVELGDPLDDLIFATAVGAGIVATALLIVGLLGGFERWIIGAVIFLAAALSWRQLIQLPRSLGAALGSLRCGDNERALWKFGVVVFSSIIVMMLVLAVAPPVDWDVLMYHLRVPDQYLDAGRIYLPEDNLHASLVGLNHMLYMPLLAVGSIAGPAILNVIFAAMLGAAVYSLCTRLLDGKVAVLTLALLWGSSMLFLVAITPRVDVTAALYVFLAHYAVLLAFTHAPARRYLLLAAALLGFAVGVKNTALPYVVGMAPIVLWAALARDRRLATSAGLLTGFGLVFAAAALPWLAKNWVLFGAPLYPHYVRPQLPPWLLPLYESGDYPRGLGSYLMQSVWEAKRPNLLFAFYDPGRLTLESEGFLYLLNPALLLLPFGLFFIRNRTLARLAIPALVHVIIVQFALDKINVRYLIPAVAPLTIYAVYIMVQLGRMRSSVASRRLLIALSVVALSPTIATCYLTLRSKAFPYLVGVSSANEYMASRIPGAFIDVVSYVNSELPPNSRILMLFDARGFYFEPQVIQDNGSKNWALIANRLPPEGCLELLNITHVMLHVGTLDWFVEQISVDSDYLRWSAFEAFEARCLEPVLENSAFTLYRVEERPITPGDR